MSHERPQRHKGNAEKRAREATWGAEAVGFTSSGFSINKKIFKTLLPQFCAPFFSEEPTRPEAPQKLLFLPVVCRAMGSLQPDPRPSQPDPRVFSIETLFGSSKRAFFLCIPSCATVACKSKGGDTSARHSFYTKETRNHR